MDFNETQLHMLFDGSQEATLVLSGESVIYENAAVRSLLCGVPLSLVLSELGDTDSGVLSCTVFELPLELSVERLGDCRLLRIRRSESRSFVPESVVAELRNLLQTLQLCSERLFDQLSEGDNELYGSAVRRSLAALQNLTERLGDMNQLSEGGLVIFPQEFDLAQLYEDLFSSLHLLLPEKLPKPVFLCEDFCPVNADPKRMEELLLYLLSNALQHCKKTDSIRVLLRSERENVRLTVEDSGSGMDSGTLASVYELNADALSAHTPLGLLLSRAIVEAHGGRMLIQSQRQKGTKVTLSLPLLRDAPQPMAECIPPEGMEILRRTLYDLLELSAYRTLYD